MEFSRFIRWTFLIISEGVIDITFLCLTYFLRYLQISFDWRCVSYNIIESISFNWSNIFWENWIPMDLHIALIEKPCRSLTKSTAKWRARLILFAELTLSLGAYCHTMWWNDSLTFCVLHFQLKLKLFFPRQSNNGLMTFTTVSDNGFLIGLSFQWQHPIENYTKFLCQVNSSHAMYLLYNNQE